MPAVSGDTTAGGLARLDWALAEKPDLVILELGANDALRGIDPTTVRANLDADDRQDQGERRQAAARRHAGPAELGRRLPKAHSTRSIPSLRRRTEWRFIRFFSMVSRWTRPSTSRTASTPTRAASPRWSTASRLIVADAARRPVMTAPLRRRLRRGRSRDPRRRLCAQLPEGQRATLGVLYVSEPAAQACRSSSASWRGRPASPPGSAGSGSGSAPPANEIYERPAAAVLTADLPADGSACSARPTTRPPTCRATTPAGSRPSQPTLALVHGDPRCPDILRATVDAAARERRLPGRRADVASLRRAAARRRCRRAARSMPARSARPAWPACCSRPRSRSRPG